MPLAFVAARGTAQLKSATTTLSVAPTATIAAGRIVVATCASDNTSTTDGETSEHTVTDTKSNVWTKGREQCESGGAASAGITISKWVCSATNELSTTDSVILTLAASHLSKVIGIEEWSLSAGATVSIIGVNGTSNSTSAAPTITLAALPAGVEYAFLAAAGREGGGAAPGGLSIDPDYLSVLQIGTSGGSGATNVDMKSQYRIATLSADTYDQVNAGGECALILVAIQEIDSGAPPPAGQPLIKRLGGIPFSPSLGRGVW